LVASGIVGALIGGYMGHWAASVHCDIPPHRKVVRSLDEHRPNEIRIDGEDIAEAFGSAVGALACAVEKALGLLLGACTGCLLGLLIAAVKTRPPPLDRAATLGHVPDKGPS
jgi:hypothetical protein